MAKSIQCVLAFVPATLMISVIGNGVQRAAADEIIAREFVFSENVDRLYRLDSDAGSVTPLGLLSVRLRAMAPDTEGRLIGVDGDGALIVIDPDAPSATPTGASVSGLLGLALNRSDGSLYAITSTGSTRSLRSIDPDTGALGPVVELGNFAAPSNGQIEGFYFDADGNAMVSVAFQNGDGTIQAEGFFQVDPLTGQGQSLFEVESDPKSFVDYDPFDLGSSGAAWTLVDDFGAFSRSFGELRFNPLTFDESAFFDAIWVDGTFPLFINDAVVMSNAAAECAADLNGDGVVDGADLAAMLAVWSTSSATADLTGDGVVNGADLAQMLAAWGGCSPTK